MSTALPFTHGSGVIFLLQRIMDEKKTSLVKNVNEAELLFLLGRN